MNAIRVDHLSHHYPAVGKSAQKRTALSDVNLAVKQGEIFGLLGPNGSGKTTLFRILSTSISASSGTVVVDEIDVSQDPGQVRRKIGVVFQNPSLDRKLTLRENLVHHGHLFGVRGPSLTNRIEEAATLLDVSDRLDDVVQTLSGGLQRRGEIAKALLSKPSVLFLDEPSTGLDPTARRAMWETLLNLKNSGVTILLTTHLMEDAERCHRLAILNHGRVVATGSPDELKSRIGGDVLTIESDRPDRVVETIRSRFSLEASQMDGVVRLERKDGSSFVPALVEAIPGDVKAIRVGKPTLDDVFAKETGESFGRERHE